MQKEHQKVLNEFEKSNEEIRNLNSEKFFLKNKINDILKRNGFNIQSTEQDEHAKRRLPIPDHNHHETKLEDSKQEDSAMQNE